ncbi:sulfate permease [Vibrio sp. JCM 19236]|nr:sulfate permease [Vibrio sp. JCM 19236]
MSESAKYILGIDLGTTHSVLSYTEKHLEDASVEIMPIPQLTAPGQVESLNQLAHSSIKQVNMKWVKALVACLGQPHQKPLWAR